MRGNVKKLDGGRMVEENVLTARLPIWQAFGSHDENVDCVDDAAA